MMIGILGFFLGNLYIQQLAILPALSLLLFIFFICVLAYRFQASLALFCCGAFVLGAMYTSFFAERVLAWQLPIDLQGVDVTVTGTIKDIPEVEGRRTRFILDVTDFPELGGTPTLLLYWYDDAPQLQVGQCWQLQVRLKRPSGFANPGSFDYEQWLFSQGVRATGYVRSSEKNQYLSVTGGRYRIHQFRAGLGEQIQYYLTDYPIQGMIQALTVGLRAEMSDGQWSVLRETGTTHLMAISGLHVGLLAGFGYAMLCWLWRSSARLCQWCPAQIVGAVAALICALLYALLAGFSVPTQRAFIMVAVAMLALISRRYLTLWWGWCLALGLVLLLDPLASLTPGFYLSFAAVAIIFAACTYPEERVLPWWRQMLQVQWCVFLGLMPLTIGFFQQVSLIGFVANLLAIPFVGFVVVPLALLGCVFILTPLGPMLLVLAAYALQGLYEILAWLGGWWFASWWHAVPNRWIILLALVGVALILAQRVWLWRGVGVLCLLPLFFPHYPQPKTGEAWLTVLDVGQGLAVVVRTRHHVLVFDTGPKFSQSFDAGAAVLIPYFRQYGVQYVDRLVLSHGHYDHIGGAFSLLDEMPVGAVIVGEARGLSKVDFSYCRLGDAWQWDGVGFEFLGPPLPEQWQSNDNSCVLKVTVGDKAILLTGDIERRAEHWLLEHQTEAIAADILVVPHHGSRTSSAAEFLAAVAPQYAIFPLGYHNRFRFPHEDVVARYQQQGIKQYTTAESGAVTIKLSKHQLLSAPQSYRQQARRYWHRPYSGDTIPE